MTTPLSVSPSLLAPTAQPTAAEMAKRSQIKQTAQDFESSFLSVMMQQMFAGLSTDGPFGGGPGEEMFRSVLTDAMAKQVTRTGGVGVAASVEREMLKLQGLS
ncbi:rod-binding protein [Phenylobacterium soli]|uniref:Chemotaxis protein chel n=1 Tax=Phenylobacterium soli TaxID=2170551 RepID=A0A328AL89_9CAUL|nr:rod-binding protein [Phenylobacterium soli]RAK55703.1 chemotaxis protein chel [Phenylobacterium soli]